MSTIGETLEASGLGEIKKIEHSARHSTACHEIVCDIYNSLKPPRRVHPLQGEWSKTTGETGEPGTAAPAAMQDAMDTEPTSVRSPLPRFDLGAITKQLTDTLNCTLH